MDYFVKEEKLNRRLESMGVERMTLSDCSMIDDFVFQFLDRILDIVIKNLMVNSVYDNNGNKDDELISLDNYNKEKSNDSGFLDVLSKKNGISCPECGKELYDESPSIFLASFPLRKQVYCHHCSFKGTRLA